jgi:hypothetical protein
LQGFSAAAKSRSISRISRHSNRKDAESPLLDSASDGGHIRGIYSDPANVPIIEEDLGADPSAETSTQGPADV